MRVVAVIACTLASLAGCGRFLEDPSSGGEDPSSGDGGAAGRDATGPDVLTPTGDAAGGGTDGASGADASDASKPAPRLDCDATVLCDGFEALTTLTGGMAAGVWDQVDENLGNASIDTANPALGAKCASFVSPENTTGTPRTLLVGNNALPLPSGTAVVDVDFDMWLDFAPAAFDATDRRNLVGIFITSGKAMADWEFAGLSVMTNKGVHAEIREFAAATSTTKKPGEDPFATLTTQDLRGAWHHYRLEATFAKSATGGVKVFVDGIKRAETPLAITRTNAADSTTTFIFWIGAGAGVGSPALTARYDNVEVRTR